MYKHCIRSLHFLRAVFWIQLVYICYIYLGGSLCICIVYVRYAFQRIPDIFFFNIQILYTSVTSYGMFFLCNSIVYVRYTF